MVHQWQASGCLWPAAAERVSAWLRCCLFCLSFCFDFFFFAAAAGCSCSLLLLTRPSLLLHQLLVCYWLRCLNRCLMQQVPEPRSKVQVASRRQ